MQVSEGSQIMHVRLRCASDQPCMSVSDQARRSPTKHVSLRWGMSVSVGSPIRHVGLRQVSDSNNIFLKSSFEGYHVQTFQSLMNQLKATFIEDSVVNTVSPNKNGNLVTIFNFYLRPARLYRKCIVNCVPASQAEVAQLNIVTAFPCLLGLTVFSLKTQVFTKWS